MQTSCYQLVIKFLLVQFVSFVVECQIMTHPGANRLMRTWLEPHPYNPPNPLKGECMFAPPLGGWGDLLYSQITKDVSSVMRLGSPRLPVM